MTLGSGEDPWNSENNMRPVNEVFGAVRPTIENMPDGEFKGREFKFDKRVADEFEKFVIPNQIPGYDQMRLRCLHLGSRFLQERTSMVDLGTSNGRMIRDLIASASVQHRPGLIERVKYLGIDIEQDMLNKAQEHTSELFSDLSLDEQDPVRRNVQFRKHDLREGILVPANEFGEPIKASLIASVLCLMFLAPEYRPAIIEQIYDNLIPGGAFIWVEKTLGRSRLEEELLTELYYDDKRRNGMSEEDIQTKRKSIEKSLIPFTPSGNMELLSNAGFDPNRVIMFWADLQFRGYLAIK